MDGSIQVKMRPLQDGELEVLLALPGVEEEKATGRTALPANGDPQSQT